MLSRDAFYALQYTAARGGDHRRRRRTGTGSRAQQLSRRNQDDPLRGRGLGLSARQLRALDAVRRRRRAGRGVAAEETRAHAELAGLLARLARRSSRSIVTVVHEFVNRN